MAYTRTLVCLANSRKLQGRCIAGLELKDSRLGAWIRPVSNAPHGELHLERFYAGSREPRLLDLVEIEFLGPMPTGCHREDHLVNHASQWVRKGTLPKSTLQTALDEVSGPLWFDGGSTSYGLNDRIPSAVAKSLRSSLKLVQPDSIKMRLGIEGATFGRPKRKIRGSFGIAGIEYELAITDSFVEKSFASATEGKSRVITRPILCISVSEPFEKQNACYKLIAGVLE